MKNYLWQHPKQNILHTWFSHKTCDWYDRFIFVILHSWRRSFSLASIAFDSGLPAATAVSTPKKRELNIDQTGCGQQKTRPSIKFHSIAEQVVWHWIALQYMYWGWSKCKIM
jgi:hypothetical protein